MVGKKRLQLFLNEFYVFHILCHGLEFNPTTAQSTMNNHLSVYNMPPTYYGLYVAILREVSKKGI